LLEKFITSETVFIEVGPGDCSLSLDRKYLGRLPSNLDVSKEITNSKNFAGNFELILSNELGNIFMRLWVPAADIFA